jgi:anti-sigma factor RsiW
LSEHLSAHIIGRYTRRELTPAELLRVDEHLSSCNSCRESSLDASRVQGTVTSLHANLLVDHREGAGEHLTYEQVAALADNELDAAEREIAEAHLELCQMCQGEVSDLQILRSSLVGRAGAATASPGAGVDFDRDAARSRRRVVVAPLSGLPVPLRVAALVLLAVSLTGWFLWSRPAPRDEGQQTQSPPPSGSQPGTSAPEIVVALVDEGGRRLTLDARGEVRGLERLSPETREAVKRAMTTGRLETPGEVAGLIGRTGTLMSGPGSGASETFSVSSPLGTVVRSDRPVFRWRPLPGASRYTVTVLDPNLGVVATSQSVSATTWTPPTALERGRIFAWQVSALKDGKEILSPAPPAPEARFQVLDAAKNDELARVEQTAADSHLVRAVLYARAGLFEDAEPELQALVAANPNVAIAQKLLQSLRNP